MGFFTVLDVLKKLQRENPSLARKMEEAQVLQAWNAVVGSTIAKHARPVAVENAKIIVEVDHPVWKSELQYRKSQIIEKLNRSVENLKYPIDDLYLRDPRAREDATSPKTGPTGKSGTARMPRFRVKSKKRI